MASSASAFRASSPLEQLRLSQTTTKMRRRLHFLMQEELRLSALEDDSEAEQTVYRTRGRGYGIALHLEQDETGRLSTMRLAMPRDAEGVIADLLFASSGIEPEIVAEAELFEVLKGLFVPVARTGHLLALKVLALRPDRPQERPQDFSDIRELLKVADEEEIRRARAALDLISRRGFDRGKDLEAELEEQLRQFREQQRSG